MILTKYNDLRLPKFTDIFVIWMKTNIQVTYKYGQCIQHTYMKSLASEQDGRHFASRHVEYDIFIEILDALKSCFVTDRVWDFYSCWGTFY